MPVSIGLLPEARGSLNTFDPVGRLLLPYDPITEPVDIADTAIRFPCVIVECYGCYEFLKPSHPLVKAGQLSVG